MFAPPACPSGPPSQPPISLSAFRPSSRPALRFPWCLVTDVGAERLDLDRFTAFSSSRDLPGPRRTLATLEYTHHAAVTDHRARLLSNQLRAPVTGRVAAVDVTAASQPQIRLQRRNNARQVTDSHSLFRRSWALHEQLHARSSRLGPKPAVTQRSVVKCEYPGSVRHRTAPLAVRALRQEFGKLQSERASRR
jgi:hypothetical protein